MKQKEGFFNNLYPPARKRGEQSNLLIITSMCLSRKILTKEKPIKRILALLVIPALMVVPVTPVLAQVSLPYTTDLIADGRGETPLDVGDLNVAADGTVTFQIVETDPPHGWLLEETHLYVGDEAPAKSAPGRFPYKHEELGGAVSDAYSVDLAAADVDGDGIIFIAAHAGLIMQIGEDPETEELIYADETAWAQGDEPIGKGKNWATCFDVAVPQEPQEPQEPEEPQVEEPEVEEPEVEEPEVEEPEVEEPEVEEPQVEEPEVEEPQVEEPQVEEPQVEEPQVEVTVAAP